MDGHRYGSQSFKVIKPLLSVALLLLRLREYGANGSVLLPWNQISWIGACTPGVLAVATWIHIDPDGSHPSRVNLLLFVNSCPADGLLRMMEERICLSKTRWSVKNSLQTYSSKGDSSLPSKHDAPQLIQSQLDFLEKELRRLDMTSVSAEDGESVTRLDALRSTYLQRLSRLRLYQAALIIKGVEGGVEFSAAAAEKAVLADAAGAAELTGCDSVESCRLRAERLMLATEVRINEACLGGWLFRGEALEGYLQTLINGIMQELGGLFAGLIATELHSEDIRSRRQFLEFFFDNHDKFECTLRNQLATLGYCAVPAPRLSLSLDQGRLMHWYCASVKDVFRIRIDCVFENWKRASQNFLVPWRVNRVWNSRKVAKFMQTSIPEECITSLSEAIQDARIPMTEARDEFHTLIVNINFDIEVSFVESLTTIAEKYSSAVTSRNWFDYGSMDAEEGRLHERVIGWLFSVVNDISRAQASDLLAVAAERNSISRSADRRVVSKFEKIENANEVLEKGYLVALDYLSCALFEDIFLDHLYSWPDLGVDSPTKSAMASLRNKWPAFASAVTDSYSFAKLLLLCADKIVVVYLTLIRECGMERTFVFCDELLVRFNDDIRNIYDGFFTAIKSSGCEKYSSLIELRLQRLHDVYALIAEDSESSSFRDTLKKVRDEGIFKRCESLAFANIIRACHKARQVGAKNDDEISSSIRSLESVYERPLDNMVVAIPLTSPDLMLC